MKRAVKDLKTSLYLKSMDEWTSKVEDAFSFRDIFQALRFCDEHHLPEVAIMGVSRDGSEKILGFRRTPRIIEPSQVTFVQLASPNTDEAHSTT